MELSCQELRKRAINWLYFTHLWYQRCQGGGVGLHISSSVSIFFYLQSSPQTPTRLSTSPSHSRDKSKEMTEPSKTSELWYVINFPAYLLHFYSKPFCQHQITSIHIVCKLCILQLMQLIFQHLSQSRLQLQIRSFRAEKVQIWKLSNLKHSSVVQSNLFIYLWIRI